MDYNQSHKLTKWILILPIVGLVLTAFLFIQTFIGYQKELHTNELNYYNTQTLKQNKLLAKEKIDELYEFIQIYMAQMKKEAIVESKEMVDLAYNIIEKTYKDNVGLSDNQIIALINNKLFEMRFFKNLDGYFYILNLNGTCLMHPIEKSLVGKNLMELKDIKNNSFIKEGILKLQNHQTADIEYYWRKGTEQKVVKKFTHMKKFEPLNILVATGRYEDNLLRDIKESIQKVLMNIRYGKKGYIFAYDGKGTTISHMKKDFIGVNRWDSVVNDEHLVRQLIKGAKFNEEGFFKSYIARFDPVTQEEAYKISFIRYINELDWIIGTGVYQSDVQEQYVSKQEYLNKKFNETVSQLVVFSILILCIILILTFMVFTKLRKSLKEYQLNLIDSNLKTEEQKHQLVYQLRHDVLTGLPNRIMLNERLVEAIDRANRKQSKIAILFMDIDNFKSINDKYGHDVGDYILKEFASCIKRKLRKSDLAARLSGDEFILLVEEIQNEQEVISIIHKIQKELQSPIIYQEVEHRIKSSIGISFYPDDGENFESLIKTADYAMYMSKKRGKNEYTFYKSSF